MHNQVKALPVISTIHIEKGFSKWVIYASVSSVNWPKHSKLKKYLKISLVNSKQRILVVKLTSWRITLAAWWTCVRLQYLCDGYIWFSYTSLKSYSCFLQEHLNFRARRLKYVFGKKDFKLLDISSLPCCILQCLCA